MIKLVCKNQKLGWRESSVVKSDYYSHEGPKFSFCNIFERHRTISNFSHRESITLSSQENGISPECIWSHIQTLAYTCF